MHDYADPDEPTHAELVEEARALLAAGHMFGAFSQAWQTCPMDPLDEVSSGLTEEAAKQPPSRPFLRPTDLRVPQPTILWPPSPRQSGETKRIGRTSCMLGVPVQAARNQRNPRSTVRRPLPPFRPPQKNPNGPTHRPAVASPRVPPFLPIPCGEFLLASHLNCAWTHKMHHGRSCAVTATRILMAPASAPP
jgi:hypothetical protein